jgi:monofunctional chorismate mutase
MSLDLKELRQEINETDREIVELFKKRMGIAASVAEYKKQNGLPVLDKAREEALLEKISALSGDMSEYTHEIYLEILKQSKEYQKKLIAN